MLQYKKPHMQSQGILRIVRNANSVPSLEAKQALQVDTVGNGHTITDATVSLSS